MVNFQTIDEKEAAFGERMIEIKVRLWTNDIADTEGSVLPKHAWSSGLVRLTRNATHGIGSNKALPFHSLMDLTSVIEKILIQNGITLHASRETKKYLKQ